MKKNLTIISLSIVLVAFLTAGTWAYTVSFDNITGNNPANAQTGETQLSLDITDTGNGLAEFTFKNDGENPSSITQIYFDDSGILSGINDISQSAGVSYETPKKVGNLPGGNSISPQFEEDFSIEPVSKEGTSGNGVNPGEWVSVVFNLNSGADFNSLVAAVEDGDLRIGFHVQAFSDGKSEAFVNSTTAVPAPAPIILLGSGLIGLAGLRKKLNKK